MNNFYNRPKRKGGFGHLESWFNDTLDLLGVLNLDVKRTLSGVAVAKSGALLCLWPKRAPQGKQIECIAFPTYGEGSEPEGMILYRSNGENFPEIENGPLPHVWRRSSTKEPILKM